MDEFSTDRGRRGKPRANPTASVDRLLPCKGRCQHTYHPKESPIDPAVADSSSEGPFRRDYLFLEPPSQAPSRCSLDALGLVLSVFDVRRATPRGALRPPFRSAVHHVPFQFWR
eukprot:1340041-Amorphochlora_amoeboformis.AAC.3